MTAEKICAVCGGNLAKHGRHLPWCRKATKKQKEDLREQAHAARVARGDK